jgi:hypothetical protein
MTGDARAPQGPAAGGRTAPGESDEDLRRSYPPRGPEDRRRLLRFAREANLERGQWQRLKGLYKLAESAEEPELLGVLVGRLDAAPMEGPAADERPPGAATLGYMKRRARRCLRRLGQRDPGRYVEVAFHALRTACAGRAALDLRCQWVSADVLYGELPGLRQLRHGRGRYVLPATAGAAPGDGGGGGGPAPRSERFPSAWDARPDLARRLFGAGDLPPEVRVAALRMLRAAGGVPPRVGPESLRTFLFGPATEAARAAAVQVADDAWAGTLADPDLVAGALAAADEATCERLLAALVQRFQRFDPGPAPGRDQPPEGIAAALVADLAVRVRLAQRAPAQVVAGAGRPSSRRQYDPSPAVQLAAALLTGPLRPYLPDDLGASLVPVAGTLLSAAERAVAELGLLAVEVTPTALAPVAFRAAVVASPSWRVAALERLQLALRARPLSDETVHLLVSGGAADREGAGGAAGPSRSAAIETYRAGWEVLARLPLDAAAARRLWVRLLVAGDAAALDAAGGAAPALELLARAGLGPDGGAAVGARYAGDAEGLARLPPPLLEAVLVAMSPAQRLEVVARADVPAWHLVRSPLAARLAPSEAALAFWSAVLRPDTWRRLGAVARRRAVPRLIAQPLGSTLLRAGPAALPLEAAPAGETWPLERWMDANLTGLARESPLLLALSRHPMPRVRARALRHLAGLGYSPTTAVAQLLSGSADAFRETRAWVLALPGTHPDAAALALALGGHPDRMIARLGRRFVRDRLDALPLAEMARRAPEALTPEAQVRLAERLRHAEPAPDWAGAFDAAVLRDGASPARARRLVMERLERAPAANVPALLSAARGPGRADAERALLRLTRLALAGHPVDGLAVDAVPDGGD